MATHESPEAVTIKKNHDELGQVIKTKKEAGEDVKEEIGKLVAMKEAYEDLVGEPMVGQKPSKKLAKKLKAAKKAAAAGGGGAQPAKKAAPKKAAVKAAPEPKKEAPKAVAPKKEAPQKEAPKKEAPKKEAPKAAPKAATFTPTKITTPVAGGMYQMAPLGVIEVKPTKIEYPMAPTTSVALMGSGSGGAVSAVGGADMDRAVALMEKQMNLLKTLESLVSKAEGEIVRLGGTVPAVAASSDVKLDKHGFAVPGSDSAAKLKAKLTVTVCCHPDAPALATLLAANAINSSTGKNTVDIKTMWHSSISIQEKYRPSDAEMSEQRLRQQGECDVLLTLIWKDVASPSLVVHSASHIPIEGDANIAKFLCRTCNKFYPDDIMTQIQIDETLNSAAKLTGQKRNDKIITKGINATMGKGAFVCGDTETVADFVLYAALTSKKVAADKNIKKWVEKNEASGKYQASQASYAK